MRINSFLNRHWPWLLVAAVTMVGIVVRIVANQSSLGGDELSTLWVVQGNSFGEAISNVHSDAEITPPLYFSLAWVASRFGDSGDLIRLPSMFAGIATIPVVYLLGLRTIGRRGAIVATAVIAVSPILVYFSANARAYAVMFLMMVCSLLFLILAAQEKRRLWWVLYAIATCLAVYAHYTAVFVLLAQLVWLLWAFPDSRKAALVATGAAAVGYLPWLPGYMADSNSLTVPILEALQADGGKLLPIEQALFWRLSPAPWTLDRLDVILIGVGALILIVAASITLFQGRAKSESGSGRVAGVAGWAREHPYPVLIAALILATPVGALLVGLVSTDVYGGRNLAASWVGIPLAIGGLAAVARPAWGLIGTVVTLAGLGVGTLNLIDNDKTTIAFRASADYIDSVSTGGDAIVDAAALTPVPLTSYDVYSDPDLDQYRLGIATSEPPFLPGSAVVPETADLMKAAFKGRDRVFVAEYGPAREIKERGEVPFLGETLKVPEGWSVTGQKTFPGFFELTVTTVERDTAEAEKPDE